MKRTLICLITACVLAMPILSWAQAPTESGSDEPPAKSDPVLAAAVKALVGTVSALSQEIRRQREDIDRLNKEVATMKKASRESAPQGQPSIGATSPGGATGATLEERLEAQRANRLELIESTAAIELAIIDELASVPVEKEAKAASEARIAEMRLTLEGQKKSVQIATAKIALLQQYIAARNKIDATDPALLLPFDPTASKSDPDQPAPPVSNE